VSTLSRLVEWREKVALEKRRAYRDQVIGAGLSPDLVTRMRVSSLFGWPRAAHGSNRTGRQFTGDASGDFLYPALYRARICIPASFRFP